MCRTCHKCFWSQNQVAIFPVSVRKSGCWGSALAAYLELMYLISGSYGLRSDARWNKKIGKEIRHLICFVPTEREYERVSSVECYVG